MKLTTRSVTSLLLILVGGFLGASALHASAGSWAAPSASPSSAGSNADAPLNVGSGFQEKLGGLWIHGGLKVDGNMILSPGTAGAGKVLTDDGQGIGVGVWQTPNTSCSVSAASNLSSLSGNSGNNTIWMTVIGVLQPGTYTFSGTGHSNDSGGGGIDAVFLSATARATGVIATYPTEVNGYHSATGATVAQAVTYGSGNPLIYAVNRNSNNDSAWTIPNNTTVTVTQVTYVYFILGQASESGYINITGTATSGCSSSGISTIRSGVVVTPALNTPITVTFSSPMATTSYAVNTTLVGSNVPSRGGVNTFITNRTLNGFTFTLTEAFNSDYGANDNITYVAIPYQ